MSDYAKQLPCTQYGVGREEIDSSCKHSDAERRIQQNANPQIYPFEFFHNKHFKVSEKNESSTL
jgi:hypothetical protein